MPDGTGLAKFAKAFPARYFDVGIAEAHAVCFAAGASTSNIKPVCAIYSTFLQRAYDQVVHDVAVQNLPVVFALDRAGFVGDDGPTHMGLYDIAYLRTLPNMTLMAPRNEAEIAPMLDVALAVDGAGGAAVSARQLERKVGRTAGAGRGRARRGAAARTRGRDPRARAIRSTPRSTPYELLPDEAKPTVVNMRFVKPLDESLLLELAETHGAFHHAGGAFAGRRVRLGGRRVPQRSRPARPGRADRRAERSGPACKPEAQRAQFGLTGEQVAARVNALRDEVRPAAGA